jgi:hypothetical protein
LVASGWSSGSNNAAIESREALEAEAARVSCRDRERDHRRLDHDRAAAAHRVEERLAGLPARERHDPGGEVFLQWRLARVSAIAAAVERLAGGVEVEDDGFLVEESVNAHPGGARVHVRPLPAVGAKSVAHGVLDRQSREFEALQGRADRLHVDPDAELFAEPLGPPHRERGLVHVALAVVGRAGKPH